MVKKSRSLGSEIYGGAAGFGRFYATYSAVVGSLLAVVCIVAAIVFLRKKDAHSASTMGTVSKIVNNACNDAQQQNGQVQMCAYQIVYGENKKYSNTMTTVKRLALNEQVTVYYDPSNENDAVLDRIPYKVIGGFLLGFGLLVLAGVWFDYYATRKYKFYAAAEGVGAGAHLIKKMI